MSFTLSILPPNPTIRQKIIPILETALAAVDPKGAVHNRLKRTGDILTVDGQPYQLTDYKRIFVIGAGKASAPMSQAVEALLGDRISDGLVVVKTGHGGPTEQVALVEASHPMPDEAGVAAGRRILTLAAEAGADDLVIALLSGGGSALLVAPADGLTLADMQGMTNALLACGATINEVNCLRKHCSAIKGGQLARSAAPATLITLALSDVIGSPLDVIASGPTVADASCWADAWTIVEKYDLANRLPSPIVQRLWAGVAGTLPDTPKADDPAFVHTQNVVVADNRVAALAAMDKARSVGYSPLLLTTHIEGEAAQVANLAVALAKEVQESGNPIAAPACLILGGETTVTLGTNPGQGGRNQELALAAAVALQNRPGITIVSLATDGTDGPTDSAGGIVDSGTVTRGEALQLSAKEFLHRHNAYPFLQATHDLLMTGPTQTNVNDLIFIFIEAP